LIPGSKFLLLAVGRRCPANNSPPRERAKRSAAARVAAGTRQQWEVRARDFDDAWTAGRPLIGPRMVAGGFHAHHEAQPAHKTTDPSPPARASGLPWQPCNVPGPSLSCVPSQTLPVPKWSWLCGSCLLPPAEAKEAGKGTEWKGTCTLGSAKAVQFPRHAPKEKDERSTVPLVPAVQKRQLRCVRPRGGERGECQCCFTPSMARAPCGLPSPCLGCLGHRWR
jgi:hypothetical protein